MFRYIKGLDIVSLACYSPNRASVLCDVSAAAWTLYPINKLKETAHVHDRLADNSIPT